MKLGPLQDLADDLADSSDRVAHDLSEGATRLSEAMRGQPRAQSLDGVSGGSGGHGDPTATAGIEDDPARDDLVELEKALKAAHAHARTVVGILDRYLPRPPSSRERRGVTRANAFRCWSCARVDSSLPVPDAQIPLTKTPTTVKGNLPEARLLCRWCYEVVRLTGRLPSRKDTRAHIKGERVFVPERKGSNRVRM